jgi:hypothetical protein
MQPITPHMMLDQYRKNADEFTKRQAELFRAMGPLDQRELLFWMIMHASMVIGGITAQGAKQ